MFDPSCLQLRSFRISEPSSRAAIPRVSPHFLMGLRWVLALVLVAFCGGLHAEDSLVDFEDVSPDLKGWSATVKREGNDVEYRLAPNWQKPFTISIDTTKPHSGKNSLKWEFTENFEDMGTIMGPKFTVGSAAVAIRFFCRTDGVAEAGIFTVEELDSEGHIVKSHWSAAKIPASNEWVPVEWSGSLNPTTAAIRIYFIYKSAPRGARVWFDDISAKPANAQ